MKPWAIVINLVLMCALGVAHAASKAYIANPYQCKSCHQAQYDFWNKTHHSSAYLVLYAKQQHLDPECVACHSVGFGEKNGFTKTADALLLKGAPSRKSGEKPMIELVLETAFKGEKDPKEEKEILALDSRVQPDRYAKLKSAFHQKLDTVQEKPGWDKVYAGVQCENCHGNRADHVLKGPHKSKIKQPVKAALCIGCHDSMRDPGFSFAAKRALVACPKIGATP